MGTSTSEELFASIFSSKDGGSRLHKNTGTHPPNNTVSEAVITTVKTANLTL
jgi:hypothetical protein